uniref:Uncharacterized protein n=1 Tax=Proboscia inermis TaxID=420281 RepID=A0A7S0GH55_9STRA
MMTFSLFLLLTLSYMDTSHAEEGELHPCACEAEEFGFKIDCNDEGTMLAAMTVLKTKSCATDCSSDECEKNYLIVQSHHDHCRESSIPEEIEDGFHDYDETCVACKISRPITEGAPECPTPNCSDKGGDESYTKLLDGGCQNDCSSDLCRDNYFMLVAVHDYCEHDTLTRASEEGLHDMEDPCEKLYVCNAADGGKDQLVCDDHSDHDHDGHDDHDDKSTAATATTTGAIALFGTIMSMV